MKFDRSKFDEDHPEISGAGLIDPRLFYDQSDATKNVFRSLFGFYTILAGNETNWLKEEDGDGIQSHNEYRLNSFGYRDPEYDGPVDLIAAGCSQTFGLGVPESARWSTVLARRLNMSVATLAISGWSAAGAINAVMDYIQNYGKPKAVALLLPDFGRFDYITNKSILIDKGVNPEEEHEPVRIDIGHTTRVDAYPKISKKPHRTEEVINPETGVFLNGQILRFFLAYCKEAGIQVVWGSWAGAVQELVSYTDSLEFEVAENKYLSKYDFSGYVDVNYKHDEKRSLDALAVKGCHDSEKENLESSVLKYYDYASDRQHHMGAHAHLHVVDAFYERLHRLEA